MKNGIAHLKLCNSLNLFERDEEVSENRRKKVTNLSTTCLFMFHHIVGAGGVLLMSCHEHLSSISNSLPVYEMS
jgi:hypothetical protein